MKSKGSLSRLFISLLLICSISLSSAFLPRGDSVTFVNYASIHHVTDGNITQKDANQDYFAILTFGVFLTNYNFSTAWFSRNDHAGTGIIENQCIKSSADDGKPASLYCSLATASTSHYGNSSQTFHFYLNESSHCHLESSTMVFNGVPIKIETMNTSVSNLNKTCTADVSYEFTNFVTNRPYDHTYDRTSDLAIKVSVSKGDCGLEYQSKNLVANKKAAKLSDIYPYISIMAGIALIQSVACGALVRSIDKDHTIAKRTSLGSICFFITFDFYIYLLHFSYWTSVSNWMAVVFILYFILSVFFEPALLYFVFTTLQNRANASIMTLLSQLYIWLLVCGACLVISQTCIPNFLFYAFPLFLVPQIVTNFTSGTKYKWNYCLLLGLGLPKLCYLAYLSLNLFRIFKSHFSPYMIYYSIGILIIEIIILKVQTRWPTFGLKVFTVESYSYLCNSSEISSLSGIVCSICTEQVKQKPLIGNQQPLMEQNEENEEIMKTPCQHYYHSQCLKEWFKKKFECPNCRQRLPILITEDD